MVKYDKVTRVDSIEDIVNERWVVLPGSYNPPTLAHISLMFEALDETGADRAAAMLSLANCDKDVSRETDMLYREGMLEAMRETFPELAILTTTEARFVDQARALREEYPDAQFDFAMGYDTLTRLFDSKYYESMDELIEYFDNHQVIVSSRGQHVRDVSNWIEKNAQRYIDRIIPFQMLVDMEIISSSDVRYEFADKGHSQSVPASVARYIRDKGLYANGELIND